MKTNGLYMKQIPVIALLIAAFCIPNITLAQKTEEKGKMHIKIIKETDGETTVIDTVFVCEPGSLEKQIQLISGDDIKAHGGDKMHKIIIECDSTNANYRLCKVEKCLGDTVGSGCKKIKVVVSGDEKDMKMEEENGYKYVIITDDGNTTDTKKQKHVKVIEKELGEGEDKEFTIIINDGNDGKDSEGKEKKKVIISCNEGQEEVYVLKLKTDDNSQEISMNYIVTGVLAADDKDMLKKSGIEPEVKEQNLLKTEDFQIFPNPGDGNFKLSFSSEEKGSLQVIVYDMQGKKVFEDSQSPFNGNYSNIVDITTQTKGMYFLKVRIGDKSLIKKLEINQE